MSRPRSEITALLAFLSDGRPKVIRYIGETDQGGSTFLEHAEGTAADNKEGLAVFQELKDG